MDTVVFDGEQYVKASVLAKKFRYTADYIGQLCRAKKVDARLVGRTWFVNPQSVIEHKEHKKLKATTDHVTETSSSVAKIVLRKQVLPVMQNKTIKTNASLAAHKQALETRNLSVAYEPDDETLLPTLIRKKTGPARTIRIEHVDAKRLKVGGKQPETNFHAGELPEVSLSGKLEIMTVPDVKPEAEKAEAEVIDTKIEHKNIAISSKQETKELAPVTGGQETEVAPTPVTIRKQSTTTNKPQVAVVKSVTKTFQTKLAEHPAGKAAPEKVIFSPVLIQQKTPTIVLMSPLIATVVAVVCVLIIFSASSRVEVFNWGYQSQIVLQVANLLEIFNQ